MYQTLSIAVGLLAFANGQSVGTYEKEIHPNITWQSCTAQGSCATNNGKLVLDANWRWTHGKNTYINCYTGNTWNSTFCPDNKRCAENCAIDGADYKRVYGIQTNGSSVRMGYITKGDYGQNIGSRSYMMKDDDTYEIFKLAPNLEFTFDVDLSLLPCGLNGALYFVAMDADGGMKRYPTNTAGARYGTGYCDSSCPRDIRYINGQANAEGWIPSATDQTAGVGHYGSCCAEMDIWEANSISSALTAHPCTTVEQTRCEYERCGATYSTDRYNSVCDPDGCEFNPYRLGDKAFFGKSKVVDTSKKFTVVTQFIGTGDDLEIKRFYIQNGKVIPNTQSQVQGITGNSLNNQFCDAQKKVFDEKNTFKDRGGMAGMAKALEKGMVLVMSVLDDHYSNMLWLDSVYPPDRDPWLPGTSRGECNHNSATLPVYEPTAPNPVVAFSNIRYGALNSTFG